MIVVDSSARVAVFFDEPEKAAFQAIIDGDDRCVLSAVNAHETACVLRGRHGSAAVERFWQWLADNHVEIAPFDEMQVRAAAVAFDRHGKGLKGSASKAHLNLADCAAYALAKTVNAPLLFKGNDFAETDVKPAMV
jgi:ribonuclease VapC